MKANRASSLRMFAALGCALLLLSLAWTLGVRTHDPTCGRPGSFVEIGGGGFEFGIFATPPTARQQTTIIACAGSLPKALADDPGSIAWSEVLLPDLARRFAPRTARGFSARFPLWIPPALCAGAALLCSAAERRRRAVWQCPHCGYDLIGAPAHCTECGYRAAAARSSEKLVSA